MIKMVIAGVWTCVILLGGDLRLDVGRRGPRGRLRRQCGQRAGAAPHHTPRMPKWTPEIEVADDR